MSGKPLQDGWLLAFLSQPDSLWRWSWALLTVLQILGSVCPWVLTFSKPYIPLAISSLQNSVCRPGPSPVSVMESFPARGGPPAAPLGPLNFRDRRGHSSLGFLTEGAPTPVLCSDTCKE